MWIEAFSVDFSDAGTRLFIARRYVKSGSICCGNSVADATMFSLSIRASVGNIVPKFGRNRLHQANVRQ